MLKRPKGGNQTFSNGILIMRLYKTDTTYKKIYVVGGRKDLMTRPRVLMGKLCKGIDAGIR